ncbi:uncharacterized protein [Centruroides vittatus]|uniref:uncharacterized protein n=1 Tax=Centruroides vittatus TaxID=120091 RepID=UPI00350EAD93
MCCCSFFSHIPGEMASEFELNAADASRNLTDFSTRESWCYPGVRDEIRRISTRRREGDDTKTGANVNPVSGIIVDNPQWNSCIGVLCHTTGTKFGSANSAFVPVKNNYKTCKLEANNRQTDGHAKIYSGEKQYKCDKAGCGKSFARNEELTRHKKIHSGIKSYVCDACSKGFGRKDHLTKHQKTHLKASEKKMHKCYIVGCNHEYTRSDALARHLSNAHDIKSNSSKSCAKTPFLPTEPHPGLSSLPGYPVNPRGNAYALL